MLSGMAEEEQHEEIHDKKTKEASEKDNSFLEADEKELADLQESYATALKNSSNVWLHFRNTCYVYLYRGGGDPNKTIAGFDLDGTIIKPKSNKKIPKSATDWQFFSVWTKVKLQEVLRQNKARFVIFTNQNGVGLQIVPIEEVQARIELVTSRLNVPCTVFMAIDKNSFRKPETQMFSLFQKSFNDCKRVDLSSSFYCGDAIGYPSHSDADIKFAKTLGLPFLTPEKFLRGVKPKLVEGE